MGKHKKKGDRNISPHGRRSGEVEHKAKHKYDRKESLKKLQQDLEEHYDRQIKYLKESKEAKDKLDAEECEDLDTAIQSMEEAKINIGDIIEDLDKLYTNDDNT